MSLLMSLVKPLAYISLPIFLARAAADAHPLARYYVRLGLYLSTLGICSVWGVISSVGMTLIGRRFDINWLVARSFYGIASRLIGITIDVEGEEYLDTKPAVLVGNHQSMLDILFIGRVMPQKASMTSKKELQWAPLLGQFMTLSGAVFIDRKNNARAVQSVAAAGETMKKRGTSLWLFPEGTRTNKEQADMLPFKKGAFYLAVEAGVPITPVVCEHYWRLYHNGTFNSGHLKVKVLPPIPTAGLTASDVSDLAKIVREQMLEALYEISGVAPPQPTRSETKEEKVTDTPAVAPEVAQVPEKQPNLPEPASAPVAVEEPSVVEETTPLTQASLSIDTSGRDLSEKGAETEEDEGMVLVGRPDTDSS